MPKLPRHVHQFRGTGRFQWIQVSAASGRHLRKSGCPIQGDIEVWLEDATDDCVNEFDHFAWTRWLFNSGQSFIDGCPGAAGLELASRPVGLTMHPGAQQVETPE